MKDPSVFAALGAGALTLTLPVENAVYGAAGGVIMVCTMLAAALAAPTPLPGAQWLQLAGRSGFTLVAGTLAAWLLTPFLSGLIGWALSAVLPGQAPPLSGLEVLVATALGFLALAVSPALAARARAEITNRRAPQ